MRRFFDEFAEELRALAGRLWADENPGSTLQPTALVNEAFLRLMAAENISFNDRNHFFRTAALTMRRVLVDHARAKAGPMRRPRGGARVSLEGLDAPERASSIHLDADEVLAIHEALERLSRDDSRLAELVELRFFGGLTVGQAAEVMGISERSAFGDWRFAKARLALLLAGPGSS